MILGKPKSWSVRLVNGYILNDQVRAEQCKGCENMTQIVVGNNGDSNLLLFGCKSRKCNHVLIRIKVNLVPDNSFLTVRPPEIDFRVPNTFQIQRLEDASIIKN